MKELIIKKSEEGITLNKYLKKILIKMPQSTYNKLLRKKYFEINGIKAQGKEILKVHDKISIFLSDETYDKFSKESVVCDKVNHFTYDNNNKKLKKSEDDFYEKYIKDRIVYEDDYLIIYNKDIGVLSQGDKTGAITVNSILNKYLNVNKKNIAFVPSVVNRLDRNTKGIIIFAKTYLAARELSQMIRNCNVEKHYVAAVNGKMDGIGRLINILKKDENNNKVIVKEYNGAVPKDFSKVELVYDVLKSNKDVSIVDINLLTGKSHQIRAQFSYIHHPLISDKKYMDVSLYKENVKKFGDKEQALICYKVRFGSFSCEKLKHLNNKTFEINVNDFYKKYVR